MKYFVGILIWICVIAIIFCELCGTAEAAPFTVDFPNSALHFGLSGAMGFGAGFVIKSESETMGDADIVLVAGTLAQIPGAYKEFMRDEYYDKGDLAFNILGGYLGAWLGVTLGTRVSVTKTDETTVLSVAGSF